MGYIYVLRDMANRKAFRDYELLRRSYLYVARNTQLPPHVRNQAQLQLAKFDHKTQPTRIKNRCTMTGRGRGVIGKFGLCRVGAIPWACRPPADTYPSSNSE